MEPTPLPPESPAAKVIGFLSNELAVPRERIGMLTRLRQDLGLNGTDAANLLEAYAITFDVNIDAFRTNDYFVPDGTDAPSWSWILWLFGNGKPLKTLTVRDLILGLEKGRLR